MTLPIGILYEHPDWFRPLFAELERREIAYRRIDASREALDPVAPPPSYSLLVNRMSPSAYLRGNGGAIGYARDLLAQYEEQGVPIVNGPRAFELERSKARQAMLLAKLGIPYPRTRVVSGPSQLLEAATELEYPLIVKPNLGGSGALMRRFHTTDELRSALAAGEIDLGPDGVGLLQEYHEAKGSAIVRVELLDGRMLYAIQVPTDPNQGFNLCPADVCDVSAQGSEGPRWGANVLSRPIEAVTPPPEAAEAALEIAAAAHLDICGIEYLESERDGQRYFYDVNALSNFVADAPRVLGFDPFVPWVDYLERRSRAGIPPQLSVGARCR